MTGSRRDDTLDPQVTLPPGMKGPMQSIMSKLRAGPARPERNASAAALGPDTVHSLRVLSVTIGCAAVLLACLVIIGGWGFDIAPLKSVLPGMSTMKVNTALGIAALGVSLALTGEGRSRRTSARVMAWLALGIGLLTLAEYALDWNLGIDQLLFPDPATPVAAHPGRPAMATALMIALLAAGQLSGRRPALLV
ncbi:MAG TPA: hypothetical protein VHE11_05815, partial [Steroidobacteraceae bacterium]|nr:hypothetical protein [Steroidobacteraceae bacterium]